MKRKGSTSDFNAERDAELRSVFFSQKAYSTSDSVLKKTIQTPASRFWVDPDRARDVMSLIEKNPDCLAAMKPERRRMYTALYEKYNFYRRKNPDKSKIDCVSMAIYSGAPEFFIAPSTARRAIYKY